ncbi:hypothetical protein BD324DRAFT_575048 [Kockovaella imperatae]|uniref:C2H2-type domain-containing protein n=1 Tax=Kockovaella imperatae TaxID=4999 RepID=A0A1Y1UQX3_9TREE|nr:hypothetical protein BD324DRAFT_575048 [Kockovaella imperatae]ORX40460.1 hypothetical protein BD324DRAFT_575048 [Kockovaella imperatae]
MLAVDIRPLPAFPREPVPQLEVERSLVTYGDAPGPSSRRLPSRTERRFVCTYEGCDKAYFKPSRLAEHVLTHTGERPHQCPHCDQSYIRSSHLKAHVRTHLSVDDKPYACNRSGCDKRFWTSTHLKRHEQLHDQTPSFECDTCGETFHKARQLRDHRVLEHMPPGTKAYPCPNDGCDWSFALHHQLKAHLKTHDTTRYTCTHPDHGLDIPSFSTWSSFQTHLHVAHPPTCPHGECHGRTFKNHQRLKDHLKVHADHEQDVAEAISTDDETKESRRAKKRRMSRVEAERPNKLQRIKDGQAGKDFACGEDGCEKTFKSVRYTDVACADW